MFREKPFFFKNDRFNLFGIIYKPESYINKDGFVFCDALAEEKLWSQRIMVEFAKFLAKKGYIVLRFDYMGNGESEGDFDQTSISTMITDTCCAIGILRKIKPELQKINLLGLRLGATIAALASKNEKNIGRVVLLSPVIEGKKYLKELFRINIATQLMAYKSILYTSEQLIEILKTGGTVNIDGYELSNKLFEELSSIDLRAYDNLKNLPTIILDINRKNRVNHEILKLTNILENYKLFVFKKEYFWQETKLVCKDYIDLYENIEQWLYEK